METIPIADYLIQIGNESLQALQSFLDTKAYSQVFLLADTNTARDCGPLLSHIPHLPKPIVIECGEQFKTIESCQKIWDLLTSQNADRNSLLVNLGGGLIGDLGGFAASCYKRGIDFVQVPTSLLAMVDASVGGKTGVNLSQFKNQVGAFSNPAAVFIYPLFLKTLSERELNSGFAEMLKHCLIADQARWQDLSEMEHFPENWDAFISDSVRVKVDIVKSDPFEKGARKALNFGHTIGHALESHFMDRPDKLFHGEAVALGMLCEAHICLQRELISSEEMQSIQGLILRRFPMRELCAVELMPIAALALQDKKNQNQRILCTLLDGIGAFKINQEISQADIIESLTIHLCP